MKLFRRFWRGRSSIRARALDPDSAYKLDLWKGQGQHHLDAGEIEAAIARLDEALGLAPDDGVALGLLAVALARAGAERRCADTVVRAMTGADATRTDFVRIGGWLLGDEPASGAGPRAANWRAFRALAGPCVAAAGDDPDRLRALSDAAYHARQLTLAAGALRALVRLCPDDADAWSMLVDTQLTICDFDAYDAFRGDLLRRLEHGAGDGGALAADPYSLESVGVPFDLYNRICRARSQAIARAAGHRQPGAAPRVSPPPARRRLGFLLPYSWFSSLTLVLDAVVPRIDRARFDVVGYAIQGAAEADAFERRFRARFDRFVDLPKGDPDGAARAIGDDGIDIVLDTTGHTRTNCLDILARRPAPVQAHYLGYNNTVAADFVDYLFTDAHHFGPEARALACDQLALMPGTVAIYPPRPLPTPARRADLGLAEDDFVFCCFNHSGKIEPRIFAAWMDILETCPAGVLALLHWNTPEVEINLRAAARRRGVAAERLVFLPPVAHDAHLARIAACDLALDTYFLGGGVTTLDALWAGVPVISARPESPMPHNGATFLSGAGLDELVVDGLADYVALARRMAADTAYLAEIRRRLADNRATAPVFDVDRHVRLLERMLEAMWANHLAQRKGDIRIDEGDA